MRTDSFSINFYPKCSKGSPKGEIPIYARITVNRKKTELATKQAIKFIEEWDSVTQRVRKPHSIINKVLNELEVRLRDIYNLLRYSGKQITAELVKSRYLGKDQCTITVYEYFESHYNDNIDGNAQYSDGTVKNYRATFNHFVAFLEARNLKKTLLIDVNESFVRKLDQYLHNTPVYGGTETLRLNTITKYHKKFRAVLLTALKEELIEKNPYKNFPLKEEQGKRTFLTRPELEAIEKHPLADNESLKRVRDLFLFSVYTGLRFMEWSLH